MNLLRGRKPATSSVLCALLVSLAGFRPLLNPKRHLAIIKKPRAAAGTKIWTHNPADCIYISQSLLQLGYWEPTRQETILASLPPGGLFVDIGANIGAFSLVVAAAGHKVEAFEPMPYNLELFKRSIDENKFADRIRVHEVAVGDAPAERVCLSLAFAGTPDKNKGNWQITQGGDGVCVPMIRPDSVITRCPDAVKVDVEGYEEPALRGLGIDVGSCFPGVIVMEYITIYSKANPFHLLKEKYTCRFADDNEEVEMEKEKQRDGDYICELIG